MRTYSSLVIRGPKPYSPKRKSRCRCETAEESVLVASTLALSANCSGSWNSSQPMNGGKSAFSRCAPVLYSIMVSRVSGFAAFIARQFSYAALCTSLF